MILPVVDKINIYMIFKSTYHIFNNPWKSDVPDIDPNPVCLPPSASWKNCRPIKLDDVELWEQIYYVPGSVGVYAAWNPYADFYIITYNLVADDVVTKFKIFQGFSASNDVLNELKQVGISLPFNTIKIDL